MGSRGQHLLYFRGRHRPSEHEARGHSPPPAPLRAALSGQATSRNPQSEGHSPLPAWASPGAVSAHGRGDCPAPGPEAPSVQTSWPWGACFFIRLGLELEKGPLRRPG